MPIFFDNCAQSLLNSVNINESNNMKVEINTLAERLLKISGEVDNAFIISISVIFLFFFNVEQRRVA
jgi:hypothetical protein